LVNVQNTVTRFCSATRHEILCLLKKRFTKMLTTKYLEHAT